MGKIIVLDSGAGVQFPKLIVIFYYAITVLRFKKNLTLYTGNNYWSNCTLPQDSLCMVGIIIMSHH